MVAHWPGCTPSIRLPTCRTNPAVPAHVSAVQNLATVPYARSRQGTAVPPDAGSVPNTAVKPCASLVQNAA
eukprot:3312514-Rhodomonas_salina.2